LNPKVQFETRNYIKEDQNSFKDICVQQ